MHALNLADLRGSTKPWALMFPFAFSDPPPSVTGAAATLSRNQLSRIRPWGGHSWAQDAQGSRTPAGAAAALGEGNRLCLVIP